ncbi:DUF4062 domain-containing protein [Methylogaea oryzae]|uniref:DUF4062 domain-containing protein n=1 Tax=Methylogaea oryzae TaxID=1295382 RepID=UPI0006D026B6|nr:DUF4062 domain-containing protein [Methylogaea oryzae]
MAQAKHPYTVFISSTYLDNQERRKLVEDAVLRAKMTPVGMERFTASANPTVDECERQARDCDVYVGIIAHRYGWIPDGKAVSITELEYDAAKAVGRPCFVFEIATTSFDFQTDIDQGPDRWAKQEKLDAFRAKYRGDQMPALFTEKLLHGSVLDTLKSWREKQEGIQPVQQTTPSAAVADSSELERYRLAVLAQHQDLPLAGFKTKLRVPIALEELYVPLHARLHLRASGKVGYADAADAEKQLGEHGAEEIPLIEAFRAAGQRKRRGLAILGDPGSGKTTHLKRLLLHCLKQGPAGLGLPTDTLPVFLPLRELDDLERGIDAFIEKTLDSPHLNMPQGFGQRLLHGQPLLLLFDGLDEVSDPKRRAQVSRWIEQAAQARPHCTAVITCRFAGYDDSDRLGAQFLELHLRPLTPEQSDDFIRNWYRAVETGLAGDTPEAAIKTEEGAASLIERLRQPDFRLARMATLTRNPLLLANLCLVHRDRGALPRNRHQLYDECIDVLLEHWREVKSLDVSVPAELGRRALQPAALWLHGEKERTRATAAQLAPHIEPVLQQRNWPGGDAEALLRAVRDESGLLTGWGQDQFGFMHLASRNTWPPANCAARLSRATRQRCCATWPRATPIAGGRR